jgi:hypothetical protein
MAIMNIGYYGGIKKTKHFSSFVQELAYLSTPLPLALSLKNNYLNEERKSHLPRYRK